MNSLWVEFQGCFAGINANKWVYFPPCPGDMPGVCVQLSVEGARALRMALGRSWQGSSGAGHSEWPQPVTTLSDHSEWPEPWGSSSATPPRGDGAPPPTQHSRQKLLPHHSRPSLLATIFSLNSPLPSAEPASRVHGFVSSSYPSLLPPPAWHFQLLWLEVMVLLRTTWG